VNQSEWVQALADILRLALYAFAVYQTISLHMSVHSNKTRAPIANLPNNAQLGGTPTIPPSYIRVRAVVWECDKGQTDGHGQYALSQKSSHL